MISRVADHLFWLGRYVERAESSARVLLVTRNLALDGELAPAQCWAPAVIVSGEEAAFRARFGDAALADGETVQAYLALDERNGSSIVRSVGAARENARSIREVVSLEAWEAVNECHLWLSGAGRALWRDDRHGFYRHVRQWAQLCQGVVQSTMLHDDAADFIGLGLMLERAGQTARILDVHHHALRARPAHDVVETALWLALLRACSGFEPFVKRHQGRVAPDAIARFLLVDPGFPRSVAFCLRAAEVRLARVRPPRSGGGSLARRRDLQGAVLDEAAAAATAGDLHRLLTRVVDDAHRICDELGQELLGAPPATAVASPAPAQ